MYLCNGGNQAWLASMAAMIVTYYIGTDWRLATAGLALGALFARVLFGLAGPALPPMPDVLFWSFSVVRAFFVGRGMRLGLSWARLRR